MARVAAVCMEEVVAHVSGTASFRASSPINTGVDLLTALSTRYQVAVLSEQTEREWVRDWLIQFGMYDYFSYVVPRAPEMPEEAGPRVSAQIKHLRSFSMNVGLLVTAELVVAQVALDLGVPYLVFGQPEYARPEWRPDDERGMRSWDEIQAEHAHQKRLKAEDKRVTANATDGRFE